MKFIADGMLGRLARWLRFMGHDTAYLIDVDDETLMSIAVAENRILLTRDNELYRRSVIRGVNAYLVKPANHLDRLIQLAARFKLKLEINTRDSRCSMCNSPLREVTREEVENRISSYSLASGKNYWRCIGCGKFYWQGSHWRDIQTRLANARKVATSDYR